MNSPLDHEAIRAASVLWETGFGYLTDSSQENTTFAQQAAAAQRATGLFIAAQAQALIGIEKRLAELVDLQRQAVAVAALGSTGALRGEAEWLAAREVVQSLLNLTPETPKESH